jgi:hypothetical protein
VLPLPSFLLLVLLIVSLITKGERPYNSLKPIPRRWLHICYLVLVAATIGMSILELVRMGVEGMGVGLLPVNTIAFMTVFAVRFLLMRGEARNTTAVSTCAPLRIRLLMVPRSPKLSRLTGSFCLRSSQSKWRDCIC